MKSKIPTKQEFMAIYGQVQKRKQKEIQDRVNKHIENISNLIRIGRFQSEHMSNNKEVVDRVVRAFSSKGYKVTIKEHTYSNGPNQVSLILSANDSKTTKTKTTQRSRKNKKSSR